MMIMISLKLTFINYLRNHEKEVNKDNVNVQKLLIIIIMF